MSKQILTRTAKVLFGALLLAWLVTRVDLGVLRQMMGRGNPLHLIIAIVSFFVALLGFQALRFHLLVRRYTDSLAVSYKLFLVGAFFNNLLPSNVGGDAVRLMYLRKMKADDWGGPLTMILVHRLSGLLVLLVAGAVYGALEYDRLVSIFATQQLGVDPSTATPVLAVVLGVGLLGAAALWHFGGRVGLDVRGFLRNAAKALGQMTTADVTWLVILTTCFHFCRLLTLYFGVMYFGQSIAMLDVIPALVVTAVVALLPITVGGMGVMEGSMSFMLAVFGVDANVAIVVALLTRVVMLLIAAAGGVVYTTSRSSLGAEAS